MGVIMRTKIEISGSPDIKITEAFDPITLKTDLDTVRVRIRDGVISIDVLGEDSNKEGCWNLYKIKNGDMKSLGIISIEGRV
jgi:hypothetical protein